MKEPAFRLRRERLAFFAAFGILLGWLTALETGLARRREWWAVSLIIVSMVAYAVLCWAALRRFGDSPEEDSSQANQRRGFIMCAVLAGVVLAIARASIWRSSLLISDRISMLNLCVDIVMGVFMVWGLFWAASEFSEQSVKPQLRVLLGLIKGDEAVPIRPGASAQLRGHTIDRRVDVGIFLDNRKPKMAQHLQVTVKVESQPSVDQVDFAPSYDCQWQKVNRDRIVAQFEDSLVVYMGQGIRAGTLYLHWPQHMQRDELPTTCKLEYKVYKSEGKPDFGVLNFAIQWP